MSRREGGVVHALLATAANRTAPAWMRISGRTLHERVPGSAAEQVAVELDPAAGPLLDHVLGSLDHSRARFEVWLGKETAHASVHIGIARVGRLDDDASQAVLPLIERAGARGVKLIATASLTAGEGAAPHALHVSVPSPV